MEEEKRYKLGGICLIVSGIVIFVYLKIYGWIDNPDLLILAPALILIGVGLYWISYDFKRLKKKKVKWKQKT